MKKLFNAFLQLFVMIQINAQTFTTQADGTWTAAGTWSGGVAPSTSEDWGSPEKDIVIDHNVSHSGAITLGGGYFRNITIQSGDTLSLDAVTISENSSPYPETVVTVASGGVLLASSLTIQQSAYFLIESGGRVTVSGTFQSNWNATTVENNGYLEVQDFVNNGTFTSSGAFVVNGNFTNHYDFTASFGGSTTIAGDLTSNGDMTVPLGSSIAVAGDFYLHDGKTADIDGTMSVSGDVTNNGSIDVDVTDGAFVVGSDGVYTGTEASGGGSCGTGGGCCGGGCGTLPVELVSFSLGQVAQGVKLSWSTATELDNDFFTIEVAPDGQEYKHLTTVKGGSTSHEPLSYTWTHRIEGANSGTQYYRLSQTDFDGTTERIGVKSIVLDFRFQKFAVYPNPVHTGDCVGLEGTTPEELWIYDGTGRLLKEIYLLKNSFEVDDAFKPGVYILKAHIGNQVSTHKLVVY